MAASLVIQDSINACSPHAYFTVSFILFKETHSEIDFYLLYCVVYRLRKEHHDVVVNTLSSYSRVPGSDSRPEGLIHHLKNQFVTHNNLKFDTTQTLILQRTSKDTKKLLKIV
jgi:hypothetical protein